MAEFAVVLPILVMLLFGIIQFGIVFNNYITLTDAVRVGARKAAVSRAAPDPVAAARQATRAAAPNLDQAQLAVSVTPSAPWTPGGTVTVSATYPYAIRVIGVAVYSGTLTAATKERIE